jgi:chorismate synthase
MGSVYGKNIRVSIFGQSHSPAIGVVIDGLPAGFMPDMTALRAFMKRRAPGQSLQRPVGRSFVRRALCSDHQEQ